MTITATNGHVFTDGETYGKKIYLSANDSADNYYEITDAEYQSQIAAKEAVDATLLSQSDEIDMIDEALDEIE